MRHLALLLPALLSAAPAMGQDWTVECATTSTIIEGRMHPAGTCAATLPGDPALRLWTAARDADGHDVRPPSVAIDFAVPPDRVEIMTSRFSANAAVLAAGATYRLDFAKAPPAEGRCTRLTVPPRRATPETGAAPRAIDRIGCQVDDPAGVLRGALSAERGVAVTVIVAGIRLSASAPLASGADAAYAQAEARLSGTPASFAPPPAAPSTPQALDLDDLEIEPPSTRNRPGK